MTMRVFKKGRGQRDIFSYLLGSSTGLGHSWKTRDVLVTSSDELCWLEADTPTDKLTEKEIQARARDTIKLQGCTVTDVASERELPQAVAYQLGGAAGSMRFYTIELTLPDPDAATITFGFVDRGMIENLQDQIQNSIDHSEFDKQLSLGSTKNLGMQSSEGKGKKEKKPMLGDMGGGKPMNMAVKSVGLAPAPAPLAQVDTTSETDGNGKPMPSAYASSNTSGAGRSL